MIQSGHSQVRLPEDTAGVSPPRQVDDWLGLTAILGKQQHLWANTFSRPGILFFFCTFLLFPTTRGGACWYVARCCWAWYLRDSSFSHGLSMDVNMVYLVPPKNRYWQNCSCRFTRVAQPWQFLIIKLSIWMHMVCSAFLSSWNSWLVIWFTLHVFLVTLC